MQFLNLLFGWNVMIEICIRGDCGQLRRIITFKFFENYFFGRNKRFFERSQMTNNVLFLKSTQLILTVLQFDFYSFGQQFLFVKIVFEFYDLQIFEFNLGLELLQLALKLCLVFVFNDLNLI